MNRAERIYRVHALLRDKPHSLEQLRRDLEVSRATLVRDLSYMKDFMGAPIEYHRASNCYRYQASSRFELPGFWLNESELHALLASERLLDQVQPGLLAPYLGPLRARLHSLLAQSGHPAEAVSERIQLQPVAARRSESHRLAVVASALLDGKRLSICYHARIRDRQGSRIVHPQRLVRYRDNWYLIAHCEQARALRIFSLDRITQPEPLSGTLHQLDTHALDHFLGASFGIFSGTATAWAILRFSPLASRWVADERWHPAQIGQWRSGHYQLQVPYSDPRELLMDILKYGPDVEVIAPQALREVVAERLRLAAASYEPDG